MKYSTANHGRRGRVWLRIRKQVLHEEPTCRYCGRPSTVVDHIIPLSKRPDLAHERTNLAGACAPCNSSKSDRLDWAGQAGRPRGTGRRRQWA